MAKTPIQQEHPQINLRFSYRVGSLEFPLVPHLGVMKIAAYFNVGDIVLYGKYKNKKGKIVSFGQDAKGNPTVELEPVPKGRKQNKTLGLFRIWHPKQVKKTAAAVAQRYLRCRET